MTRQLTFLPTEWSPSQLAVAVDWDERNHQYVVWAFDQDGQEVGSRSHCEMMAEALRKTASILAGQRLGKPRVEVGENVGS